MLNLRCVFFVLKYLMAKKLKIASPRVELPRLGNLPGAGVTISDPIMCSFDREETRGFDFDAIFAGLEEGAHDLVIHARVDGGFVAAETDGIIVDDGIGDRDPGAGPALGAAARVCRFCSSRLVARIS